MCVCVCVCVCLCVCAGVLPALPTAVSRILAASASPCSATCDVRGVTEVVTLTNQVVARFKGEGLAPVMEKLLYCFAAFLLLLYRELSVLRCRLLYYRFTNALLLRYCCVTRR